MVWIRQVDTVAGPVRVNLTQEHALLLDHVVGYLVHECCGDVQMVLLLHEPLTAQHNEMCDVCFLSMVPTEEEGYAFAIVPAVDGKLIQHCRQEAIGE
jgi:hypothetical protein